MFHYLISTHFFFSFTLVDIFCMLVRVGVPSVAETAAVLGLKSWVRVDARDLGPPQGPGTELLGCVRGGQHEAQCCYVRVHVHLCSEAL